VCVCKGDEKVAVEMKPKTFTSKEALMNAFPYNVAHRHGVDYYENLDITEGKDIQSWRMHNDMRTRYLPATVCEVVFHESSKWVIWG
jgi:hypothetical protein